MLRRWFLLLMLASVLVVSGAPTAWAGPTKTERREARAHLEAGIQHAKKEAWKAALPELKAALALHDTPGVRYQLGKALAAMGKVLEARAHVKLVLANKSATWWQRKHSRDLLKSIEGRIAHLKVDVPAGFDGVVRLNSETLERSNYGKRREVNPGITVVRAEAPGFVPFEITVVLSDGHNSAVKVVLKRKEKEEAAPKPPPKTTKKRPVKVSTEDGSTRRTLGYLSVTVGGVGVIAGTAFGLASRRTREDLSSSCPDDVCSENQREVYDRGKLQATASTAGFIVGGVGLGLGVLLLWTGPSKQEKPAATTGVAPFVGPGSVGLQGRF